MNKEMMKFWITCPDCKKKFGVLPAVVIKYVDRLFSQVAERIKRGAEKVERKARPRD